MTFLIKEDSLDVVFIVVLEVSEVVLMVEHFEKDVSIDDKIDSIFPEEQLVPIISIFNKVEVVLNSVQDNFLKRN